MSDIPISIDGSRYEEPKGLISAKSKGPNQEANISYTPEPGVTKDPTDDIPSDFILCSRAAIVLGLLLM